MGSFVSISFGKEIINFETSAESAHEVEQFVIYNLREKTHALLYVVDPNGSRIGLLINPETKLRTLGKSADFPKASTEEDEFSFDPKDRSTMFGSSLPYYGKTSLTVEGVVKD
ncbi:hypothetical protein ACUH97_00570 [Dermabacteraceae bacterium P13088]